MASSWYFQSSAFELSHGFLIFSHGASAGLRGSVLIRLSPSVERLPRKWTPDSSENTNTRRPPGGEEECAPIPLIKARTLEHKRPRKEARDKTGIVAARHLHAGHRGMFFSEKTIHSCRMWNQLKDRARGKPGWRNRSVGDSHKQVPNLCRGGILYIQGHGSNFFWGGNIEVITFSQVVQSNSGNTCISSAVKLDLSLFLVKTSQKNVSLCTWS